MELYVLPCDVLSADIAHCRSKNDSQKLRPICNDFDNDKSGYDDEISNNGQEENESSENEDGKKEVRRHRSRRGVYIRSKKHALNKNYYRALPADESNIFDVDLDVEVGNGNNPYTGAKMNIDNDHCDDEHLKQKDSESDNYETDKCNYYESNDIENVEVTAGKDKKCSSTKKADKKYKKVCGYKIGKYKRNLFFGAKTDKNTVQLDDEASIFCNRGVDSNDDGGGSSDCSSSIDNDECEYQKPLSEKRQTVTKRRCNNHDEKWEVMYHEFFDYVRNNNNSACIPSHYEPNIKLGRWVANQRSYHKHGTLSKERYHKLNKLNFIWKLDSSTRQNLSKDSDSEDVDSDEDTTSAKRKKNSFRRRGRNAKKKIKYEPLNEMIVYTAKAVEKWNEMYCLYLKFIEENNGKTYMPSEYPQNKSLGWWCAKQRSYFKHKTLTKERFEKLDAVGFPWFIGHKYNIPDT